MLLILQIRIVLDKDKFYMGWLGNREYLKWQQLVKILKRIYK